MFIQVFYFTLFFFGINKLLYKEVITPDSKRSPEYESVTRFVTRQKVRKIMTVVGKLCAPQMPDTVVCLGSALSGSIPDTCVITAENLPFFPSRQRNLCVDVLILLASLM